MNYFNNINLNQNELQKAVMHPLEQPPATAKQGQMYFNTVDKKLYYYNNTAWVALNDIDLSNYVTTTQLNDGLNKKLDKQTTDASKTQVYAVTGSTQKMINATSAATEDTVVLRDANGRLQVAAGAVAADAVNKGQMDTAIATAIEAGISGLERTDNKVIAITGEGSEVQYPSTGAVIEYVKGQVSKVKDVTLDGTSIVNTETGVVALESTPYIELSGTNGSIDAEQYKNLSGDKQSYIILTYTGYPYRLPYVANNGGGLIYSTIIPPRANSKTSLSKLTVYINGSQSTWEASETPVVTSAGGTIDGSVTIGGNLTVQGTTTTVESATLKVKDQLIEVASGNTAELTSPAGLIVPKYDGTNNGALVFDKTGTAYVGDAVLNADGLIDTTATGTKLVALAGRDKEANLTNNHVVKWDATNKILVDTGIDAANILTNGDLPSDYVSTTKTGVQTIASDLCIKTGNQATTYKNGSISYTKDGNTEYNLILPEKGGTVAILDEVVTLSGTQTITGAKTFSKEVAFDNHIRVNGSVGTAGQVLTSQGVGQAPQWTTLSIPQGTVKKFVNDFTGNNTDLEFSFEHKLGTDQCTVSLYKLNDSNNYEMVMADIILTATNVIIKFAQAPVTTDSFRVVVTG